MNENSDKHKVNEIILILIFAAIGYVVQASMFINEDVASLLFYTKVFLNGGEYVNDIFETNPPMIFFICSPVYLIGKITGLSLAFIFRIYLLTLAVISIIFCSKMLKNIIQKKDSSLYFYLLMTLLLIFMILPWVEFGQREHIMIILIMPYVLAAVLTAMNRSVPFGLAVIIGIMGGFGFGLKPYFLISFVLIELYLMLYRGHIFSFLRKETLICCAILILYFLYIYNFQVEYIDILLPLITQFYFKSIQQSWLTIFTNIIVIFCFSMLAFFLSRLKKQTYKELSVILLLTLMGMILAFIVPRSAWWYHVLPAFSFICLLIPIFIYQFFASTFCNGVITQKQLILIMLSGFVVPVSLVYQITHYTVMRKSVFTTPAVIRHLANSKAKSIYCFSARTTAHCFPLADLTQRQFVGRFPFFLVVKRFD